MAVTLPPDPSPPITVSRWLAGLDGTEGHLFQAIYGGDKAFRTQRARLIRRTLEAYRVAFGEGPVRIFRAPGRINPRGMHVDTHGGFLNLLTHQREVVVVAATSADPTCRLVNTDPNHSDITFSLAPWRQHAALTTDWAQLIATPEAERRRGFWGASWGVYAEGALLRAAHALPQIAEGGFCAAVGSDLPSGAALSSSAALGVALLMVALGCHHAALPADELVLAARDAEWFTGSRCGVSDQLAIVLGRRGQYVHGAPFVPAFTSDGMAWGDMPDDLSLLVADSRTTRSISGSARLAYTRNRFAYALALELVRQELLRVGTPPDAVRELDRLSRMTPERFGGDAKLYDIVAQVPVALSLEDLRTRYVLPELDTVYRQYFGDLHPDDLGGAVALRGPLLYGLAESERARLWPRAVEVGDYTLAGRLMTIGHDGDRVVDGSGRPLDRTVGEEALRDFAARNIPLALIPGDYGASTSVLDGMVDAALASGALGASLTGAGLAGCVLALCHRDKAEAVAEGIRRWLGSPEYARRTGAELPSPLVRSSVSCNQATAGACELCFPVG